MSGIWEQLSWVALAQSFSADASQAVDPGCSPVKAPLGQNLLPSSFLWLLEASFPPHMASPVTAWCLHNVATGSSRVSDSRGSVGMHSYSIYYTDRCWGDISQGCDYLGVGILGDHPQGCLPLMPHFFSKCPPTFPSWLQLSSVHDVSTHRLREWTYGCRGLGWGEGMGWDCTHCCILNG